MTRLIWRRVEAFSLRGQILISDNTYGLTRDSIDVGNINEVSVKGKSHPIKIYELLAVNTPIKLRLPGREGRKSPRISVNLPLNYQVVLGKQVISKVFNGEIVDIGYGGIMTRTPQELELFSEIKLSVSLSLLGTHTSDAYAKVLRTRKTGSGFESGLEFTVLDENAKKAIKVFVETNL